MGKVASVGDEGEISRLCVLNARDANDLDVAVPVETAVETPGNLMQFQSVYYAPSASTRRGIRAKRKDRRVTQRSQRARRRRFTAVGRQSRATCGAHARLSHGMRM